MGQGIAVGITNESSAAAPDQALLEFTPLSLDDQAGELVAAIQRLALARSVEDVRAVVGTAARRLTGADGATFVLREGDRCHYVEEDAISPLWKGQRFPLEACISGWAMLNRATAVIDDIYADDRIPHEAYRPTFVRSLVMVPIRTLDPIGAIGNYWAAPHRPTEREVQLLQALADSTAVAMANVRAVQELERAELETLQRLALAAEYRDDTTSAHTERVARTSVLLAEKVGLPESDVALIRRAAPLHDIGKVAVSDRILLKPGKLTPEEFEQMKKHAVAGAALLSDSTSDVLRRGREIALTHHERWDGSGYPAGLRGADIPLSGRVVAVADVFDALTHERPYKRAWPTADAVAEMRRLRGRHFDPDLVDAFTQLDAGELVAPVAPATRSQAVA